MSPLVLALVLIAAPERHVKHSIPGAKLEAAARYSAQHQGLSLLVWQHGKLHLERYAKGTTAADKNRIASIAKNFWALGAAIAVEEGWLRWDEHVADTLEEWREDPKRAAIEVRHLLSMSSGLDPGYSPIDDDATADKLGAVVPLRSVAAPGAVFTYGPANMSALGELMRRKLNGRGDTLVRFLERRVLGPLGIDPASWGFDLAGNPMMASGPVLTARELLRFARVVLAEGAHEGKHLVGPEALAPWFEPGVNPMYGLTFWLNRGAAQPAAVEVDVEKALGVGPTFDWSHGCFSKSAPTDLVVMLGSWNQRVYVSRAHDLIVVRQGKGTDFRDAEFLALLF